MEIFYNNDNIWVLFFLSILSLYTISVKWIVVDPYLLVYMLLLSSIGWYDSQNFNSLAPGRF